MKRVAKRVALLVGIACKEEPKPAPPPRVDAHDLLTTTFADTTSKFAPGDLEFFDVKADGTFAKLVITRRRRVTKGQFDPNDSFNCPKTTWADGLVSEDPRASCASGDVLERPRCSIAEVRARAAEEGAPASALATIEMSGLRSPLYDGPHWVVKADGQTYEYADDCLTAERGNEFARRLPLPPTQPVTADNLTRAATAWLAEKHPTLVANHITVGGVRADGTLDPEKGGYWFFPGVEWPEDKPPLDLHHYGGRAPYGICKALTWTTKQGWRLSYDASCADVERSPTCKITELWRRALLAGEPDTGLARIEHKDGTWTFAGGGGVERQYHEPCE